MIALNSWNPYFLLVLVLLVEDDILHMGPFWLDARFGPFPRGFHHGTGHFWTDQPFFCLNCLLKLIQSCRIFMVNSPLYVSPQQNIKREKIGGPGRPLDVIKSWDHLSWKTASQNWHVFSLFFFKTRFSKHIISKLLKISIPNFDSTNWRLEWRLC